MPANTKPVPWNDIKRRWEAGEAENAIAEDLTSRGMKISKQAIRKRRVKEGWTQDPRQRKVAEAAKAWQPTVATQNQTGNQLATGANRSTTQIVNWGCRTPDNAAQILAYVQLTGDTRLAARAVGIHHDTLKRWRESDPDFAAQLEAANAEFCLGHVEAISKAGRRGDWKASDRLLQTNPLTKEAYGQAGSGGGQGLTVNLRFNLERGAIPRDEDIVEIESIG